MKQHSVRNCKYFFKKKNKKKTRKRTMINASSKLCGSIMAVSQLLADPHHGGSGRRSGRSGQRRSRSLLTTCRKKTHF